MAALYGRTQAMPFSQQQSPIERKCKWWKDARLPSRLINLTRVVLLPFQLMEGSRGRRCWDLWVKYLMRGSISLYSHCWCAWHFAFLCVDAARMGIFSRVLFQLVKGSQRNICKIISSIVYFFILYGVENFDYIATFTIPKPNQTN